MVEKSSKALSRRWREPKQARMFFVEYPSYRAIFMEIATALPELNAAVDAHLIQTLTTILPKTELFTKLFS
ncbi:MAG: hypothetical protein F6J95_003495 [Leptolyngbya sp. SIO1E4]|nr:hypothetical protein [Leptolyngbya sp. SIO1E4]